MAPQIVFSAHDAKEKVFVSNQIWVERIYYTGLDQVWSILPATDLLTREWLTLWREKSSGSNSDAGKMDPTWPTHDCEKLLCNLHMR